MNRDSHPCDGMIIHSIVIDFNISIETQVYAHMFCIFKLHSA